MTKNNFSELISFLILITLLSLNFAEKQSDIQKQYRDLLTKDRDKHRRRRKGAGDNRPPAWKLSGQICNIPGKFENIRASLKMKTFF